MSIHKLQKGPSSNKAILTSNSAECDSLEMPSDAELKNIDGKIILPNQLRHHFTKEKNDEANDGQQKTLKTMIKSPSTQQAATHGFSIDHLLTSGRQNRRRRSSAQFDSENEERMTKILKIEDEQKIEELANSEQTFALQNGTTNSRQIDEKWNPFPSFPIAQCQETNLLGPNQGIQPGVVNLTDLQHLNALFMGQTATMENLLALARASEILAREQQQQSNQQQGGTICTASQALGNLKNTNESSSSSGGSNSVSSIIGSSSAPNLSFAKKNDQQITLASAKFPPYIRQIVQNGQKQFANLEEITFGNVPARLSLLYNRKYPISLAEIHRRLSSPECLNTSYLSGILRRAKNKDGGSKLRQELAEYDCGLQLHTGLRQSAKVTTYTALCEREALQLAKDFGKIANDPDNGFPHHQLAVELSRRSMVHSSPEQRKQKLDDVKGTMELLRSAISIVEQSIGQETLQLNTTMFGPTAATVDDHQQLTPQTLDQFKRFARFSHCFGNRAVLICLETMLKFERIHQSGDDTENGQSSSSGFMTAGTSQQQNDEQMSANCKFTAGIGQEQN